MKENDPLVCVVDDDPSFRESVRGLLRSVGLRVESYSSAGEFLGRAGRESPGCLVLDVELPGLSGLELQRELFRTESDIPIVFITGHGDISMSVRAIKAGAFEFLTKPFDPDDLIDAVQESLLTREYGGRGAGVRASLRSDEIVGTGSACRRLIKQIEMIAPTDSTVLIQGETGTGKELVAREIHQRSRRREQALVRVNCASVPKELYESEFFGHVRGAFTGAVKDRVGRFEAAQGGTLFLDEIGETPIELQSKLLRALQEKQFERVGEDRTRRVDVRVVAATNRDLKAEVAAGRFREDLYYRLNVLPVRVVPLRERREDIPALATYFVDLLARELKCSRPRLTEAGVARLLEYDWPGNIRELRNVIERAIVFAQGKALEFDLPARVTTGVEPVWPVGAGLKPLAGAPEFMTEPEIQRRERENLRTVLNKAGWRIGGPGGAAELLGVKPTTLTARIKKMGLVRDSGGGGGC